MTDVRFLIVWFAVGFAGHAMWLGYQPVVNENDHEIIRWIFK